ncbi:hypothetical protein M9H77_19015 [Catharanthus roseus]|uniref:Uncharacterized protein n=1 Tax=Catharanthus roseus TaxID=4058 RepID=A0ACC0B965_CATRO|nr:hypothetical protein M9H77_19015 [Catharanthus roseus]
MEEVPAHVHPGPIVPDVLSRQHDHFSGYKVKKEPLEAWILRAFTGSETDDDLILHAHGFIFLLIGGHMLPDFSGNLVHVQLCTTALGGARQIREALVLVQIWEDGPAVVAEALSYPSDEYIRWYRGITRVYIGNLLNRDTRSHGYQLAGVDRRMMVSSPNKYIYFKGFLMHFSYLC